MFKQKLILSLAAAVIVVGFHANTFANGGGKEKKQVTFTVRVENISDADGLVAADGTKYPFALSPGFFIVSDKKTDLFKSGKRATPGIESLAEDGSPELLSNNYAALATGLSTGVFTKPVGNDMPSPILAGGSFEFEATATEGMRLHIVTMFGQSNDLFYAAKSGVSLFNSKGEPITGDVSGYFLLWDAGTEVNQAPGIGSDQGPRQKAPNTGSDENGVVRLVKDDFSYPNTREVLRVTVTAKP